MKKEKMRVVEINSVNHGSTGTIMRNIAVEAAKSGIDTTICFQKARSTEQEKYNDVIRIGNRVDRNIHLRMGKLTGKYGLYSKKSTGRFLKEIDALSPDIIHLHNLHKGYINFEMLFSYIKKHDIPVIWTLHDCWSFTGQCPYFTKVKCEKWKKGCCDCPQYRDYPALVDNTEYMYERKKQAFSGVKNLILVSPSQWLADLTRESFLCQYSVKVIPNGIDLDRFYPRNSCLRKKIGAESKTIILGVASIWDDRKGLSDFIKLNTLLPKEQFMIILIGLSDQQISALPEGILGIKRTKNVDELAEYYSVADVLFNPTIEDNFPTVNIEALACGTPVFTYCTGGSPEAIDDSCGRVVDFNKAYDLFFNIDSLKLTKENCIKKAKSYDERLRYKEYIDLYKMMSIGKT